MLVSQRSHLLFVYVVQIKLWDVSSSPSMITSRQMKIGSIYCMSFYPGSPFILTCGGNKGLCPVDYSSHCFFLLAVVFDVCCASVFVFVLFVLRLHLLAYFPYCCVACSKLRLLKLVSGLTGKVAVWDLTEDKNIRTRYADIIPPDNSPAANGDNNNNNNNNDDDDEDEKRAASQSKKSKKTKKNKKSKLDSDDSDSDY